MTNDNDLKNIIAQVNKQFGNTPDEWQRQLMSALGRWAGQPEQPGQGTAQSAYSYTKPGVREFVPGGGMTDYDRALQMWAVGQASGISATSLERDDRIKAVQAFRQIGGTVPPRIVELQEMQGALYSLTLDVPTPRITDLTPDNVTDVLAEYADEMVRLEKMREVRDRLAADLTPEIVKEIKASVSHVLADKKIRDLFSDAAKRFTEAYPRVRSCKTVSDAAMLDQDGSGVAAWHKAVKAARDLDAVTDVIIGFAMPDRESITATVPRRRISPSKLLGISAEPPADTMNYTTVFAAKGMILSDFRIPTDLPFGVYGCQLDAGCTLALPKDAADLNDRAESFNPYAVMVDHVFHQ